MSDNGDSGRDEAEGASRDAHLRSGVTAVPAEPPRVDVGEILTGRWRYRLDRKLGVGGTGAVFQATCLDADETRSTPPAQVAVKVLHMSQEGLRGRAVRQELASLRAVRSRHIPPVYDWSLDGERGFVAIELYLKGTLRDHLRTQGGYSESQAWRLLRDLLDALIDAHNASVLHLDIKPSNVLLDDDAGHVLTDFGISQGAHASGSLRSIGRGTPGFQAPEQKRGEHSELDMRTDLYGIGATVWSAFTRINLASKRANSYREVGEDCPYGLRPLRSVRPDASKAFENVVMRLLHRDKSRRPGSAPEVLAWIERLHGGGADVGVRLPGRWASDQESKAIVDGLVDPLWHRLFRTEPRGLRLLEGGEELCRHGERSYFSFVLVQGTVEVIIGGEVVAVESREGTFFGEVSALTGARRTATLRARGKICVRVLNASQLESLVTRNPSIGVRLIRAMAWRLTRAR